MGIARTNLLDKAPLKNMKLKWQFFESKQNDYCFEIYNQAFE